MFYGVGDTIYSLFRGCCSKPQEEKKAKQLEDREVKLLTWAQKAEIGGDVATAALLCVGASLIVFKVISLNPMIALGAYTGAGVIVITDVSKFMIQQARHSSRLQDRNNELNTELNESDIPALKCQINDLNSNLSSKYLEIQKLQNQVNQPATDHTADQKIAEKDRIIKDLTTKLNAQEQIKTGFGQHDETTIDLTKQIHNLKNRIQELEKNEENLSAKNNELNGLQIELTELKTKFNEAEKKLLLIPELEEQLEVAKNQNNKLTKDILDLVQKGAVLQKEKEVAEAAVEQLKIQVENLEKKVAKLSGKAEEQQSYEATPQPAESESSPTVQEAAVTDTSNDTKMLDLKESIRRALIITYNNKEFDIRELDLTKSLKTNRLSDWHIGLCDEIERILNSDDYSEALARETEDLIYSIKEFWKIMEEKQVNFNNLKISQE